MFSIMNNALLHVKYSVKACYKTQYMLTVII